MKKIILFILLSIWISEAKADKFQIIALNTPQITINGKTYRKGDIFDDTSNIKWIDNKQSMEVKNLSTGTFYRFSKKVFDSKSVLSVADYFKVTKRASTRGDGGMPLFKQSPVKGNYPEKRIALVIGNSDYYSLPYLRNAQKDASDVANLLLELGFDVVEAYECSFSDMRTALNNFSSKARQYDVALFYYAGHGLQDDNQNYLIPVDCPLEFKSQLKECLNADDVLQRLDDSGAGARLMFLDACRNTKKSWTRASQDGLARMEGSIGSVIMFSTQSGQVAIDGEDDNSPFATSLMKNIARANIGFPETMQGIVRDTYALTEQKQYPLQVGTLISDFSFNSPLSVTVAPQPASDSNSMAAKEYYEKGNRYSNEKNYTEAFKWHKKAAELGYAPAQNDLGAMYHNGKGVNRDYVEALKWYLKAAESGYSNAQYNLGVLYRNGFGVPRNDVEAVSWYRKAADQNHALAQYNLGVMYHNGWGIKQDYFDALKWYLKAAEQGNSMAQNNLGFMYHNGQGIPKNVAEAFNWYRKAAEQGNAMAQSNLATMYENGQGVPKNLNEAIKWYRKSAAQGYEVAKNALMRLNAN